MSLVEAFERGVFPSELATVPELPAPELAPVSEPAVGDRPQLLDSETPAEAAGSPGPLVGACTEVVLVTVTSSDDADSPVEHPARASAPTARTAVTCRNVMLGRLLDIFDRAPRSDRARW